MSEATEMQIGTEIQHWDSQANVPGILNEGLSKGHQSTKIPGELQINSMERPACCWAVSIQDHELLGIDGIA